MLCGDFANDERYRSALQNQRDHAKLHAHAMRVITSQPMSGFWSKLSFMLQLILEELERNARNGSCKCSSSEEAGNLTSAHISDSWVDSDVLGMNRNIPLEIFLPPEEDDFDFSHINALFTRDYDDLNTEIFFLRVNQWSAQYLVDIIAFHRYRPEVKLQAQEDQHSQQFVSRQPRCRNSTFIVPARWFNAARPVKDLKKTLSSKVEDEDDDESLSDLPKRSISPHAFDKVSGWKSAYKENIFEPGDMMMHFSNYKRKAHLLEYVQIAAQEDSEYQVPLEELKLEEEVAEFWRREKEGLHSTD